MNPMAFVLFNPPDNNELISFYDLIKRNLLINNEMNKQSNALGRWAMWKWAGAMATRCGSGNFARRQFAPSTSRPAGRFSGEILWDFVAWSESLDGAMCHERGEANVCDASDWEPQGWGERRWWPEMKGDCKTVVLHRETEKVKERGLGGVAGWKKPNRKERKRYRVRYNQLYI